MVYNNDWLIQLAANDVKDTSVVGNQRNDITHYLGQRGTSPP